MPFELQALREAIRADRVTWQQHALERVAERKLHQDEVIRGILTGEVIEDYPQDYPLPSALVLYWRRRQGIHVVVGWDAEAA